MRELTTVEVQDVNGGIGWDVVFSGVAIVGAAIFAVAILPEVIAIASVAGIAALVTEGAGVVVALVGVAH